jgi:hypothetical protein
MNYDAISVREVGAGGAAPAQQQGTKRKAPEPSARMTDAPSPKIDSHDEAVRRLVDSNQPQDKDKSSRGGTDTDADLYRRKIILRLKGYAVSFPDLAGEILKSKSLEDMDTRQLEILLNEVRITVANKTSNIVTSKASDTLLTLGQYFLAENTALKVTGPKIQLLQITQNPDYQDLVKEMTLEYAEWVYQSPLNR